MNHLIIAVWASAIFSSICESRASRAKLQLTQIMLCGQILGASIAKRTGQAMSLVAGEARPFEIFGQIPGIDHGHRFLSA